MNLKWFNAEEAAKIGVALADEFAPRAAPAGAASGNSSNALERLLQRADGEVRSLSLNFYKKAKFANSFKWRLIENGIAREFADEITQSLVLHLSQDAADQSKDLTPSVGAVDRPPSANRKELLTQGKKAAARGAYEEAARCYQKLVEFEPRNAEALNYWGAALGKLGLLREAEQKLRQALGIKPDDADAHCNLGIVLGDMGQSAESEVWLRRAVKLMPNSPDARLHHGVSLFALGRLREARARFEKVLKVAPRHPDASLVIHFMGHIERMEGRFEEAEARFKRALKIKPRMPSAWAALAGTRKMTPSDAGWLHDAQEIAASEITPLEKADLLFAIGKFYDDVNDFEQAFQNYRRANQLLKSIHRPYERDARTCFVDDMVGIYTPEAISTVRRGVSASVKPIFVVGMPRSGTSLAEQIIASHPSARGAGELGFCDDSMLAHDSELRQGVLSEPRKKQLTDSYLSALEGRGGDAPRIVDKSPLNSDYLGAIYSALPNARIIHMRRDPIDVCLSCYFQNFSGNMNYTTDLSDLAHYFREHQRLMTHWHAVLPPGSILDVPYAELVADQERWTRKILDFLSLDWDARCLDFYETERQVVTASTWQVRQKMYTTSIARWRNYEKFIGPLLDLKD